MFLHNRQVASASGPLQKIMILHLSALKSGCVHAPFTVITYNILQTQHKGYGKNDLKDTCSNNMYYFELDVIILSKETKVAIKLLLHYMSGWFFVTKTQHVSNIFFFSLNEKKVKISKWD